MTLVTTAGDLHHSNFFYDLAHKKGMNPVIILLNLNQVYEKDITANSNYFVLSRIRVQRQQRQGNQ